MTAPTCKGCGEPLAPQKAPGRRKVWCGEACRRRTSYRGTCVDCGAPTGYSGTSRPNERCRSCGAARAGETRTVWTCEAIIIAAQRWNDKFGDPPAVHDWNVTDSLLRGDPERYRRALRERGLGLAPSHSTVYNHFGSWNGMLKAAGFPPRAPNGGGGNQYRTRRVRAHNRAWTEGHSPSVTEIEGEEVMDEDQRRRAITGRDDELKQRRNSIKRGMAKHKALMAEREAQRAEAIREFHRESRRRMLKRAGIDPDAA